MAFVYVTEFSGLYASGNQTGQMALAPPLAQQQIAIGAGSVASSAFNAATNCVRVHTDAVCSIAFGNAPVATAVQLRLAANQTEYFAVPAGSKVAVIINT